MNNERKDAKMYFMAVVLPQHLDEKVLAFKQWMKEMYGSKVGLKSPAHITIAAPFWMEEAKEERLIKDMETIGGSVRPFPLATSGFSAFKPRTIFVAVEDSEPLQALKKASDNFFRQTDYNIKIENRPFHPHITIATRDLHKKDFTEAWPHFETKSFKEDFIAEGLSLLKHNGSRWDVMYPAPFTAAGPGDAAAPL